MPLIVEDGTPLTNSNGYASAATVTGYFTDRLNTAWTGSTPLMEAAIIRACAFLDARYRDQYPGYRTKGRNQGMEWPRVIAYTHVPDNGRSNGFLNAGFSGTTGYGNFGVGYDYILPNVVPHEIIAATCEAALRELATPGILAPDLERGGAVRRLKAGDVEIEYSSNASATTVFQMIDLALVSLLLPRQLYSGRVSRG